MHLLRNGEKQDESNANNVRQKALVLLCRMQPSKTLLIRNRCIEMCKMPSLAIALTLEQQTFRSSPINIVSFMTGLLLGTLVIVMSLVSENRGFGYPRNGLNVFLHFSKKKKNIFASNFVIFQSGVRRKCY